MWVESPVAYDALCFEIVLNISTAPEAPLSSYAGKERTPPLNLDWVNKY